MNGEVPYMVGLKENDNVFCGGVIISDKWILSTASCIKKYVIERKFVLAKIMRVTELKSFILDEFCMDSSRYEILFLFHCIFE